MLSCVLSSSEFVIDCESLLEGFNKRDRFVSNSSDIPQLKEKINGIF
jgi:hypothetical protein